MNLVRQLDCQLYALGTRVSFSNGKRKGEVKESIRELSAWVGKASALDEGWVRELDSKIREMSLGLQGGQPEEELFEPLLRCLVEASSRIKVMTAEADRIEKRDRAKAGGLEEVV